MNVEVRDPFWRSQTTWNPIWRFLLSKLKYKVPSGDLHQNTRSFLAISFSQTTWNPIWRFLLYKSWNLRSLLATSIDEYKKRDPFWRSQTTWNPIWWFLFTECYRCRSSCWQGLKTIIFSSCCSRINSMILSSSTILLECTKISSCNDIKKNIHAMIYD